MAYRESRGIEILLCFGLFLFSTSLCRCARLTSLKARDELGGNSMLIQSQDKEGHQRHGRLLIGQNLLQGAKPNETKTTNNFMDAETDYQADMDWGEIKQPDRQHDGSDRAAMERLLKMDPKVECTLDSMKLQVYDAASTLGSLFFVDRGSHLSPLPLSKLPSSCGHTIRSTQRDLVLVAPYDGCFVALEEDSYVLPLLWWGLPVRMLCPLMSPLSLNPPTVTCSAEGMLVKTEWTLPVSKVKVKLNGNWEPLTMASNRCGFSTVEHPEGVVISAHYAPCLDKKDGLYTLEVAGDGETTISCPSELPAQPENPANDPEWQNETPSKGVSPHDPDQPLKSAKVAAPQLPGFSENSNMPKNGPEDTDRPPLSNSYRPFYPSFLYPYSASPVNAPAVPSVKPILTSYPVIQTTMDKRWQHFFPTYYSQPPATKSTPTQPPVNKPPAGQFEEHLLPNPFNPIPSLLQKPLVPPASQPESQEKKPLYPFSFYPLPSASEAQSTYQKLPEKPGLSQAPRPEAQAQVYQPFYFHPLYNQLKPEIQTTTKPATVPQPPQPEAPQPQVHQQMYFCPENQVARNPNAVLMSATETLLGQVHKLCQQPDTLVGTNDETVATEKPAQSAQPPFRHTQGQMHHLFNQFYYPQQLQVPQPVASTSTTHMQQQVSAEARDQKYPESAIPLTSNGDAVIQGPQLSSAYIQPVYCPQFFFSGLSNCCPQIAFYQHLHIAPAQLGSKNVPPLYPDLPFLPSAAYFEFGVGSARLSQKPNEAAETASATTYTSASFPSGNAEQPYFQPLDGNPATLQGSNPSWTADLEPLLYYNLAPSSLYSHWPYLPQNEELQWLPQSQALAHYSEPSKPLASGNPVVQYEPNNIQSPVQPTGPLWTRDLNNPSWPNFMSNSQNSQQQQNTPGKELDQLVVPFYRLQHTPIPTYDNSVVPNNSRPLPFMGNSKNSKHEQVLNLYSEPENYLLLQHGPPGREPNSFIDSSMLFRDLTHNANVGAQNLARDHNSKHQTPLNLKPLQEKSQLSKSLGKGMPSPSPGNVNYEHRLDDDDNDDDNSGLPLPVSVDPPPVFPRYKPSLGAAHLNPKFHESFKDLGRSLTPLGSSDRFPPQIPQKMFQSWSSEADY